LISGFISGILSKVGEVASAASSVVSRARDFFPFSPAKEGPFSGKGWTLYSGQSIGDAMAAGIRSREGAVRSAVSGLMSGTYTGVQSMPGATVPGGGVPGWAQDGTAAGGPASVSLTINSGGSAMDDLLVQVLRRAVQTKGRGNVQVLLGGR
jgi:hypothetical protein